MNQIDFYPILENGRARLSPLRLEDTDLLWETGRDPGLWRITNVNIQSRQDMEAYVLKAILEREQGQSIPFMVWDLARSRVAGSTRFMNLVSEHRRVEIGSTWIGREFQGTGLNTHMKWLMLQYAFDVLDLNRVELKTDERNIQSQRAMRAIGARMEGTLRSHMVNWDGWVRNSVYFSIIKEEWPLVKKVLARKLGTLSRVSKA